MWNERNCSAIHFQYNPNPKSIKWPDFALKRH